jgi:RNA polymerase sigma factor (sigma-70 family)
MMMMQTSERDRAAGSIDFLAKTYAHVLTRFFERRVSEQADVEDLVQEVFLRLTRHGDLSDVENIEGYLFQTAANVLRDRLRQRTSRQVTWHEPIGLDHEVVDGAVVSPERVLQGKQAVRHLSEALLDLPERTRAVFVLCRIEGKPHVEVAMGLGTSLSTVNKHLAKAMDQLSERMREVL